MRDYQTDKTMEQSVYRRALAMIRDCPRMNKEATDLLRSGLATDEEGKRMMEIIQDIATISQALRIVPEEYRTAVWANIVEEVPFKSLDVGASKNTISAYRSQFIRKVAELKRWINNQEE